jgi:hypothetical protein
LSADAFFKASMANVRPFAERAIPSPVAGEGARRGKQIRESIAAKILTSERREN